MKANPLGRSLLANFLTAAASLGLMAGAAISQQLVSPPCLAFPAVVETLHEQYQEEPIAAGLVYQGAVVVLFAAPAGETWTLVVRNADGKTCFLASGQDWTGRAPSPAGKEG